MRWVAWGAGNFFRTAFNPEKRAIDRLVDSNPALWGKYVHGYPVEDPAVVLSEFAPGDTAVLVFAVDKAGEIRRVIAGHGPFPVLAMGDLVRTEAPQWSDFQARRDMTLVAWEQATRTSSDYVYQHMESARHYWDRAAMLGDMVAVAALPGLFLEFGVAKGASLCTIASATRETVHGFDSFQGLPEAWGFVLPKGAFAGDRPEGLPVNVCLHVGMFDDTLPGWTVTSSHMPPAGSCEGVQRQPLFRPRRRFESSVERSIHWSTSSFIRS